MADHLAVGCGYLGLRAAVRWRARGHRVFATTRHEERLAELNRLGLDGIRLDVLDPAGPDALPATDVVLYAVGYDRGAGVPMRAVHVDGLANVLPRLRAGRILHVSSTGVYGHGEGEEVDESALTGPVDESGRVVLEAEQVLRRHRPDALVLRLAGIYGPGRLPGIAALRRGEPVHGDPDRWLNLIHVEDAAEACVLAAEHGVPGEVYNVSDGHPVRRRDFYASAAQLLGVGPPRFVPADAESGRDRRGNRRISNCKLRERLGLTLCFPSFGEGLAACLAQETGHASGKVPEVGSNTSPPGGVP
jgi:nucleoside-diphosphate-sugar epimerase